MSEKPSDLLRARISRRKFAQAATIAAAGAVVLPRNVVAQAESNNPGAALAPVPQQPALTPQEEAEAAARTSEILRKYGLRMSDAEKADVRRQVRESQKSLSELRAFPLTNADAPATVLRIRRRENR
jgi:hypothetical protein